MEISKIMKKESLFKKYSVKELLSELKKLKLVKVDEDNIFLSEISKNQKKIFKAFGIDESQIKHSY